MKMRRIKLPVALLALSLVLPGCSSVKNLFGAGNDDTVLPGQREDVLPPESQTAQDPQVMGKQAQSPDDCPIDDPNCNPPLQEDQAPVE
jgi:predicted small secreted protein